MTKGVRIGAVGVIILGVVFFVQTRSDGLSAQTAFNQALLSNLQQAGISCTIQETSGATKTNQKLSLDLDSRSKALSVLTTTTGSNKVVLEERTIGQASYIRYTTLQSAEKNAAGETPDFAAALNVWAKSNTEASTFAKTALGACVVPLAQLSPDKAQQIGEQLAHNHIFQTDFSKAKQTRLDGKAVWQYEVAIQPRSYIALMKQVGTAYKLDALSGLKESSYADQAAKKVQFYVGGNRLIKISDEQTGRSIAFSDFGLRPAVTAPASFISDHELQAKLRQQ